jgi:integrase/recombinase XerD
VGQALAAYFKDGRPPVPNQRRLFLRVRAPLVGFKGPVSADAVQRLLAKYQQKAGQTCPSLKQKRLTPHVLRHTAAMRLLQAGIDRAVIALWLGHDSVETTQIYLDADLALKEQALAKTTQAGGACRLFKPEDPLLAFLKSL